MSRSRYTKAFDLHNMVPAPAAIAATVQVIYKSEDGILLCYGTAATNVAPLTTASVYSPGCIYFKIVAGGTSIMYLNTGTTATPAWTDQK